MEHLQNCDPVIFLETWEVFYQCYFKVPFVTNPNVTQEHALSTISGRLNDVLGFDGIIPKVIGKSILNGSIDEFKTLLSESRDNLILVNGDQRNALYGAKYKYANHEISFIEKCIILLERHEVRQRTQQNKQHPYISNISEYYRQSFLYLILMLFGRFWPRFISRKFRESHFTTE